MTARGLRGTRVKNGVVAAAVRRLGAAQLDTI